MMAMSRFGWMRAIARLCVWQHAKKRSSSKKLERAAANSVYRTVCATIAFSCFIQVDSVPAQSNALVCQCIVSTVSTYANSVRHRDGRMQNVEQKFHKRRDPRHNEPRPLLYSKHAITQARVVNGNIRAVSRLHTIHIYRLTTYWPAY